MTQPARNDVPRPFPADSAAFDLLRLGSTRSPRPSLGDIDITAFLTPFSAVESETPLGDETKSPDVSVGALPVAEHVQSWNVSCVFDQQFALATPIETPLEHHAKEAHLGYDGCVRPDNEVERSQYVASLRILDSPYEDRYDSITRLLAELFAAPVALMTTIHEDRAWLKSIIGWEGVTEGPRTASACAFLMLPRQPEMLVLPDMAADARFAENPWVAEPIHLRSYMGAPLVASNGMRIGSLCILDWTPRLYTVEDCVFLANLAELGMREIELQFAPDAAGMLGGVARAAGAFATGTLLVERDPAHPGRWTILYVSTQASDVWGQPSDALIGRNLWDVLTLSGPPGASVQALEASMDALADFEFAASAFADDGRKARLACAGRVATAPLPDAASIGLPPEIPSEDSALHRLWFVSVAAAGAAVSTGPGGKVEVRRRPNDLLQEASEPGDVPPEAPAAPDVGLVFIGRDSATPSAWKVSHANAPGAALLARAPDALIGAQLDDLFSAAESSPIHESRIQGIQGAQAPAAASEAAPRPLSATLAPLLNGGADFEFEARVRTDGSAPRRLVHVTASCCTQPALEPGEGVDLEAPFPRHVTPAAVVQAQRLTAAAPGVVPGMAAPLPTPPSAANGAADQPNGLPPARAIHANGGAAAPGVSAPNGASDGRCDGAGAAAQARAVLPPGADEGGFVWCLRICARRPEPHCPPADPPEHCQVRSADGGPPPQAPAALRGVATSGTDPTAEQYPPAVAELLASGGATAREVSPRSSMSECELAGNGGADVLRVVWAPELEGSEHADLCVSLGRVVTQHLPGFVRRVASDVLHSSHVIVHVVQVEPEPDCDEVEAGERQRAAARRLYHHLHAVGQRDNDPRLKRRVLQTQLVCECQYGDLAAVATFKAAGAKCLGNLRTLVHGNAFKSARGMEELRKGTVAIHHGRVCRAVAAVADAVAAVHELGVSHGEVTDLTVLMLAPQGDEVEPRPVLTTSSLSGPLPTMLEDVVQLRDDYVLFFAPERYGALFDAPLSPPSQPADVWSLGILMLVVAGFSLPLVDIAAADLLQLALAGTLAATVFKYEAFKAPPDYIRLALRCLDPDASQRPSAAAVRDDVQRILADLAT